MTTPKRIQRQRRKGWKMPDNTIYVGRPSKWGNPYVGDGPADAAMVVHLFRRHLERPEQAEKRAMISDELRGKNLACWCPLDAPCQADVLLEIANV